MQNRKRLSLFKEDGSMISKEELDRQLFELRLQREQDMEAEMERRMALSIILPFAIFAIAIAFIALVNLIWG